MASMLHIFVVGCPRSGTTLVQSLLSAHPRLTGFTESHVFDKAYDWRGDVNERELQARITHFLQENNIPESLYEATRFDRELTAERFIALLDEAACRRGAGGWVEKTPDHVFRIPLIERLAPDAKFIHVVRRAEGVLPSLHKASHTEGWADVKPWWECAAHWLWALRITNRYVGRAGHCVVGYEQLVANPHEQMQRVLALLGLAWDEAVVREYGRAAAGLIGAGEQWKVNATGPIENKNTLREIDLPWTGRVAVKAARRLRRVRPYLA
jgi:hypothetical protein